MSTNLTPIHAAGARVPVAIIGSGNIGTDLMMKLIRSSECLSLACMVGIDRDSEGLRLARKKGITTTDKGLEGLAKLKAWNDIEILFDATSAKAHIEHHRLAQAAGKRIIDLTPAAIGPYVVPVVNATEHLDAPNVNMISCGGQATIPIVAAAAEVSKVHYAEIVASIASRSAGPGTRANIDEFTVTTAKGIEIVGGAERGKAIIILNPAEPSMIMRDTVHMLVSDGIEEEIDAAIRNMVKDVQAYVPGFRLKQEVQFESIPERRPLVTPGYGEHAGLKVSVFLEVEGAADYLPAYAGNLDIMTSAALSTGERLARHSSPGEKARVQ